jgi:tetratricopeptide (TPR) repeat protein
VIDTLRVDRQFTEAIKLADSASAQYPKDRLIILMRSSVLADMNRGAEAVAEVKKLIDGQNDRATYLTLAQTYEKSKNFAETSKAIDAAEKLSATNEEKESIYLMRGEMFEKMKRIPEAEAEFRKALAISPDSAGALNYIGYMLADRNTRLPEALTLIQKALELEPNSGAYLDSLGWVYFRLGRFVEAEETLVRAAARTKRDPTVHSHLAETYLAQGKFKEALESFETSLKLWRESAPAEVDPEEIASIQKKIQDARARQPRAANLR